MYKGSRHRIPHTPSQQAPGGRGPPKGANRQSSTHPGEAPAETSLIQKEIELTGRRMNATILLGVLYSVRKFGAEK